MTISMNDSRFQRPRICLIDVPEESTDLLNRRGYNCFSGTLGPIVRVNNASPREKKLCRLNCRFPENMHEYDIVVVDLQAPVKVDYSEEMHTPSEMRGRWIPMLESAYPEKIFDPRAMSSKILESELEPVRKKESVIIVFAEKQESIEYQCVAITIAGPIDESPRVHTLYDFYPNLPVNRNVSVFCFTWNWTVVKLV